MDKPVKVSAGLRRKKSGKNKAAAIDVHELVIDDETIKDEGQNNVMKSSKHHMPTRDGRESEFRKHATNNKSAHKDSSRRHERKDIKKKARADDEGSSDSPSRRRASENESKSKSLKKHIIAAPNLVGQEIGSGRAQIQNVLFNTLKQRYAGFLDNAMKKPRLRLDVDYETSTRKATLSPVGSEGMETTTIVKVINLEMGNAIDSIFMALARTKPFACVGLVRLMHAFDEMNHCNIHTTTGHYVSELANEMNFAQLSEWLMGLFVGLVHEHNPTHAYAMQNTWTVQAIALTPSDEETDCIQYIVVAPKSGLPRVANYCECMINLIKYARQSHIKLSSVWMWTLCVFLCDDYTLDDLIVAIARYQAKENVNIDLLTNIGKACVNEKLALQIRQQSLEQYNLLVANIIRKPLVYF